MSRVSRDEHYLQEAVNLGNNRGTCIRRKVGCVLVNHRGKLLSTGYNGPPSQEPHCIDHPCAGSGLPSGEGLSHCEAVHAELNALLQCSDIREINTCYVTCSPCIDCVKILMNTSCLRIVFRFNYPHLGAKARWIRPQLMCEVRQWLKL